MDRKALASRSVPVGAGDSLTLDGAQDAIAGRLRQLRRDRKLRLHDVARRLGISDSQLSRIETGRQEVSVVELMRFARLYDYNVSHFFLEEQADVVKVTRRGERRRHIRNVTSHGPVIVEQMTRASNVKMEPALLLIPASGGSGDPISHEGEEFITVLDGSIRLNVGERSVELHYGDTAYYPCSLPHSWANLEDRPAIVMAVSSPPSY